MRRGVMRGPDGILTGTRRPERSSLTWVPPTSIARIFIFFTATPPFRTGPTRAAPSCPPFRGSPAAVASTQVVTRATPFLDDPRARRLPSLGDAQHTGSHPATGRGGTRARHPHQGIRQPHGNVQTQNVLRSLHIHDRRARHHRDPLHAHDGPAHRRCAGRRRHRSAGLPVSLSRLLVPVPLSLRVPVSGTPPLLRAVQRPTSRLGCRPLGVAPEPIAPVCPRLGPTISPMNMFDLRAAVVLAAVLVAA